MKRFLESNDLIMWVNALIESFVWGEENSKKFESAMFDLGLFLGLGKPPAAHKRHRPTNAEVAAGKVGKEESQDGARDTGCCRAVMAAETVGLSSPIPQIRENRRKTRIPKKPVEFSDHRCVPPGRRIRALISGDFGASCGSLFRTWAAEAGRVGSRAALNNKHDGVSSPLERRLRNAPG
ncbi:hypothetical protein [Bradyrhizobium sp. GM2.2]|uniref:hypothetical protein n=1 Tax=Bradyrhizobium sp. GM2.2 TaxID=3156358 RepID=UPI00339A4CF6